MQVYEQFSGNDLVIAQKIKQRRLQMLVHSHIYYELNDNIISDSKWSEWATELMNLQNEYPNISEKVLDYAEAFKNWDASTGAFLPLHDEWVVQKSLQLLHMRDCGKVTKKRKSVEKRSLF